MASRRSLTLCAVVAAFAARAAELPVIRLDTVFPPGGKAGADTEVAITGADLDEAKALHFSHPGITAEPKEKRFVVKIAPDVPPGVYDVRVSGLLGVSNPRAFVVSDLPQTTKPSANSTPATAVELPLDSTIAGTATAAAADYFKFTAKKGQRLLFDCEASSIDSRMNPILAVLDSANRELESSRRGGLLDFTAPAAGTYLLKLHDLTFAGGAERFYRLTLTAGPRIDYVLPPCAQPGTKTKFTFFGRNLPSGALANIVSHDGKPLEKLEAEIDVPAKSDARVDGLTSPAAAALDGFSYRLKSPHGSSDSVFICFANAPVIAEQEGDAQRITPPCEIAGQFFPAADTDTFTFDAKKGDVWRIEVISQRLGLATNPFLLVQDAETYGTDTNIGGARFSTASADPAMRFEAKVDGPVRVSVRDLFGGARKDPRNVYRLAIRKEAPDFQLVAIAEPPPEKKDDRTAAPRSALLRGGGTIGIKVAAFRRDGFAGEIELRAEGLPPSVTCVPVKIPGTANEGTLLLTAAAKPERWVGSIRIVGKSGALEHDARGGAVRWTVADFNTDAVQARLTRDFMLAVSGTEAAPVSVAIENKTWEAAAGAKLEIPLKVTRVPEFKEALKLKASGAPGFDALKEIDVAPAAADAKATIDLAALKIPTGEHTIHFEAQTKGKFRGKDVTTTIYSAPIRISVK